MVAQLLVLLKDEFLFQVCLPIFQPEMVIKIQFIELCQAVLVLLGADAHGPDCLLDAAGGNEPGPVIKQLAQYPLPDDILQPFVVLLGDVLVVLDVGFEIQVLLEQAVDWPLPC